MHFKRNKDVSFFSTFGFILITFIASGCGILGSKNVPTSNTGSVGATGCLNNSPNLVSRYVAGQTSESEWKAAFDCVNQSLNFFTNYVHGSTAGTYTENDMYTLVSKFLITNQPVHQALVEGALSLKASLLGGDPTLLTTGEITLIQNSLTQLSNITATLIPYLAIQQQANPSYDQLNSMVTAFQTAGQQLSDFVSTLPTEDLSDDAVSTLISELTVSLNLPVVTNLSNTIFLAKWMLFDTRRDAVQATEWPMVFKTAMGLSGIMLAYEASLGTDPNAPQANVINRLQNDYQFREFVWGLAQDAQPYIANAITLHGGAIPFPLFDHLIESIPATALGNVPASVLEETIRPMVRTMFSATSQIGVDQTAVNNLFSLVGEMVADLGLLDRFYQSTGFDVNSVLPQNFTPALTQYAAGLSGADQVRFAIIQQKLLNYEPLFFNGTYRIQFQHGIGYSKNQHLTVLLIDRVVRFLMQSYASNPGYFLPADLENFFHQYQDILFALQVVDPTLPDYGTRRLQEMDLFTNASDGNGQASVPEIVNYGMEIISASEMSAQMRTEITPVCDVGLGVDIMGWTMVPASCFRQQFGDRLSYWINSFPRLQKYWNSLTPAEQAQDMVWIEQGARRDGYSNEDFGQYDFSAMGTILHYTETLFTRFDADSNEIISKDEIGNAYPIFKMLLAQKANVSESNDYMLKGIFTYIVKYRQMPETSGIGNLAKLAWWLAIYDLPTTNYSADRSGVFNIVCQLGQPESASQQALTPTICSQASQ